MHKIIFLLLFGALWLLPSTVLSQPSGFVRELDEDWLVYDDDYESYVPYVESYHGNLQKKHLVFERADWLGFYLKISAPKGTLVFVDNRLYTEVQERLLFIPINELGRNRVLVSVFQEEGNVAEVRASIVEFASAENLAVKTIDIAIPRKKEKGGSDGLLTILGVSLLGVLAAFARISTPILDIPSLRRYISVFWKIKPQAGRIQSSALIFFLILYTLSFSFIAMIIKELSVSDEYIGSFYWLSASSFGRFIYLILMALTFNLVKFILIWVLSILYDFRKIVNIHIQEFMNVNQLYSLLLAVAAVLLHFSKFSEPEKAYQMSLLAVVIGLMACAFLVSYRIIKVVPFRKLYLFSYLCATEIIPALVLVKFLMES